MENPTYELTIRAGSSGVESTTWAKMLAHIYERWLRKRRFEFEVLNAPSGSTDEIDRQMFCFKIKDKRAYEYLCGEAGVHRLVRVAPSDADGRRHTSFVFVYTCKEDKAELAPTRSYVLDPYQRVKDHLTGLESENALDVLDHDGINTFIEVRRIHASHPWDPNSVENGHNWA